MAHSTASLHRGASHEVALRGPADSPDEAAETGGSLTPSEGPAEDPLAACRLRVLTLEQPTYYLASGFISTASGTRPCSCRSKGQLQHVPMTVGDCCIIGDDCVVQAASLGNCVEVGSCSVVGNRCLLKDFCVILPDSVLPPDTIVPAFTVFGGVPARLVAELPESWALKARVKAKTKYRLFAPALSKEEATT
ncbi:hypothetical protein Efla_005853 [Eimeria flavescens]